MPTYESSLSKQAALTVWRLYFILAALMGLLASGLVFQVRSAQGIGLFGGLSAARLVILALMLLVGLAFAWLAIESWVRPQAFERRWDRLRRFLARRNVWICAFLLCGGLFLLSCFVVTSAPDITEPFTRAYFDRLVPLALWLAGLSLQTLIVLWILRHGVGLRLDGLTHMSGRVIFLLAILVLGGIFAAWSWAARVVLPEEAGKLGWNAQGVPLIEGQVLLAWLAGMGMLALVAWANKRYATPEQRSKLQPRRIDLLVAFFLWLAAVVLWQSAPLAPNWFVTAPTYPNYEYYPSSDARASDTSAQTALIGEGYRFYDAPYVRRSLLAMYMTVLHVVGGQDYQRVIFLQILVLALIPVVIYFLTSALSTRVAGVIAAGLIILRETNSIRLAATITTSNVKLLMADLPSALMVAIFIYLVVLWLQNPEGRRLLALACGGVLGLAMLVRLETVTFFFPLAVLAAFVLFPKRRIGLWAQSGLLAGLGIILAISPWVYRNYRLTGDIFIDHPYYRFGLIIQRFNPAFMEGTLKPRGGQPTPTETPPDQNAPKVAPALSFQPPQSKTSSVLAQSGGPAQPTPTPGIPEELIQQETGKAIDYIAQNPAHVLGVMLGHYLHSQVQTFLILPSTFRLPDSFIALIGHRSLSRLWKECCSLEGYLRHLPYWRKWDGTLPGQAAVPLILNMLLIAVGVQVAWQRSRWAGLTPLLLGMAFLFFNGIFRNSGGRYLLPVDWTVLIYFAIGLARVSIGLVGYLAGKTIPADLQVAPTPGETELEPLSKRGSLYPKSLWRAPAFYGLALGFFLLGCLVPLVESSFAPRFSQARQSEMLAALLGSDQLDSAQTQALQSYLSNGAFVMAGRALYPRYFPPNYGEDVGKRNPLAPKPYPRMVFYLAGLKSENMALPLSDRVSAFPNASDVLIIACPERDLLAVARFAPAGSLESVLLRSPFPGETGSLVCPLPPEAGGSDN
jgi:hypothetical protein